MATEEDDEWSTSANEVINISFLQASAGNPQEIASFHPEYTEQQFDREQSIFGYKDLQIDLRFAAHDLFPNFTYKFAEKWKTVKDAKAADIDEIFGRDLSPDALLQAEGFEARLRNVEVASEFKPPGKLVSSYSADGRDYEIYAGELADDGIRKIIERVQILVTFFIDGGIPIPTDDSKSSMARWRVWLVYEKIKDSPSPYSLAGYCTAYRFLPLLKTQLTSQHDSSLSTLGDGPIPTITLSELPNRSRISQFLILPHHQGQSHGRRLYDSVVDTFINDPACIEITVEDPNEAFDDLRDFGDYTRLTSNGTFAQIKMNIDLDPKLTARRPGVNIPTGKLLNRPLLKSLREKNKIAPRQFKRLVEMYLLSQIPRYTREAGTARLIRKAASSDKGDKAHYYWRLLVKERLFKQHKDLLQELERSDRIEKLEDTLDVVSADYERLLAKIEIKSPSTSKTVVSRGKRKIIEDDDDEDGNESVASQASKKPKA